MPPLDPLERRLANQQLLQRQLLSEEECFYIIVNNRKELKTSVITSQNYPINKMIRHSKSSFFEDDVLRDKLGTVNKVQFQFTEYKKTGFYKWHRDSSLGREYTHIIALNREYTGGELQFKRLDQEILIRLSIGECYSFPSDILHRVQSVLSGVRYSLVGWEHAG